MIPIAKPFLDEREADAVRRVIFSGWIMQGPEVAAFEHEFAEYVIASANSIRYCGATPVFVDVESDTFNIDPGLIEAAIGPLTRAILCVHQMGMPCDLNRIAQIAEKHSIPLIEDAACAIGSEILSNDRWERIGKPHGDAACFSFHPRKILSTGEGGMITTKHKDWDARFRSLRQHGMSVSDTFRHASDRVVFESYTELGFNYRMTDLQAAIGREQLKRLPDLVTRRRVMAAMYRVFLGDVSGLGLPVEPEWARSNWQSYCVRLPEGYDQREIMQSLLNLQIATRRGIMCIHREPAYENQPWRAAGSLYQSERAQDQCILLPIYHQLEHREREFIASHLQTAINAANHSLSCDEFDSGTARRR